MTHIHRKHLTQLIAEVTDPGNTRFGALSQQQVDAVRDLLVGRVNRPVLDALLVADINKPVLYQAERDAIHAGMSGRAVA